jgi:vanillate O-demethylase ferredoxin subunit
MAGVVNARVVERVSLSSEVCGLTLERVLGRFAGLEAGAHIDVHLDDDTVRQYSLTEWDEDGRRVSVAVKREPDGRGGSLAMHALAVGDVVPISDPRNNFRLAEGDKPRVLVAGGIGITPLYAMARALSADGLPFDLHYMVRSRSLAAFDGDLRALGLGEAYHLSCDDEDGIPDFMRLVERYPRDTRFYVCGPEVMLTAMQKASEELAIGSVSFERFAAVPSTESVDTRSFQLVLNSSEEVYDVPADRSILQVLREAGRDVDWGCTEGVCGTCITDVLEGDIEHRDSILSDEEQQAGDCMCICVSRAKGSRLVLDL